MLQIRIVQKSFSALFVGVFFFKIEGQLQQRFHGGRCFFHLFRQFLRTGIKEAGNFGHGFFTVIPPFFHHLRQFRRMVFTNTTKLAEIDRRALPCGIPASANTPLQLPNALGTLSDGISVGTENRFIRLHCRQKTIHLAGPIYSSGKGSFQDLSSPGSLPHIITTGLQCRDAILRPFFRQGVALHLFIERQNQSRQSAVIPAGSCGIHQIFKSGYFMHIPVSGLHDSVESFLLHGIRPVIGCHFKPCGDADLMPEFLQDRGAEMMNSTDLSVSAQCLLVTDMIDELLRGILILFRFRCSLQ